MRESSHNERLICAKKLIAYDMSDTAIQVMIYGVEPALSFVDMLELQKTREQKAKEVLEEILRLQRIEEG